ncbi:hypothetical protein [Methylobacterium pseudosasicola]|uniref:Uncharacterized protein n=1 Tax=Methylobacterium pseudosasicola TaxID=582667 RepID=A0A1I4UMR3_9HYPH|nr:hypothetical protein [Methylobacterium pseudosasicola]SFM90201.1 hypothetical protein SAMN05192568_107318 [Methylobacterium pseudosasicola]
MGLTAFLFFVLPWMAFAFWLSRLPNALRLGTPTTPWRALTDYPDPVRDQRHEKNAYNVGSDDGSGKLGGDKHSPLINP